jgi:hypothetical protein
MSVKITEVVVWHEMVPQSEDERARDKRKFYNRLKYGVEPRMENNPCSEIILGRSGLCYLGDEIEN